MKPELRSKLIMVTALFTFTAFLLAGAGPGASAGEPKRITSLGGPNAFERHLQRMTADEFKTMCVEKRDEIVALFHQAGWPGNPEDFLAQVAAGRFTDVDFPVGGQLEWMMFRRNGAPTLEYDFVWAGSEPFKAFKVQVKVADEKNCKDYVYDFIIPKKCGNISLYSLEVQQYKATVKASLKVTPESACVCSDLVVDATGSSAMMNGRSVLAQVMAKVVLPNGSEEGLGAPEAPGVYRWKLNYGDPGTYRFTVEAVAADCDRTSHAASAVFDARPCPPVCSIDVDPDEVYTREVVRVDTSGSEAGTGDLEKVAVTVSRDGDGVEEFDLEGDLETTKSFTRPGEYAFNARAYDSCGQASDNDCGGRVRVLSRWHGFVELLGGKERRLRVIEDEPGAAVDGHCEPLAVLKVGAGYMAIPRRLELAGAVGYAYATDNTDYYSVFADIYADLLFRPWFVGFGAGYWDFSHSETDAPTFLVHSGVDLWRRQQRALQLVAEGRLFLDELNDIGNNYIALGGFRFSF